MSDESKTRIDPRFDPAFQRGFDPSTQVDERVPIAEPRRAPLSGSSAVSGAPTPIAAPAKIIPVQAPPPPPVAQRSTPSAATTPATSDDVVRLDESTEPEDVTDDANPTRNPFLLALGIIAVVLVAVGIWLFDQTGDAFNSREVRSQGDYMTLVATIQMAPFIALLGGATAIGVIFMFAAKWRRRR